MIYKTLKKVSEYCQLLDKSKFPATQTVVGVTFTNNGDGSITANGTSTGNIYLQLFTSGIAIKRGKYLLIGCPSGSTANTYHLRITNSRTNYTRLDRDNGAGVIFSYDLDYASCYITVIIYTGTVCDNLVFKPQLFDLTEMYGAGNEPTTVEQFRQDFPEEMYDYKPYCFIKSYKTLLKASNNKIITSYKKSLVCKTKNLFDYTKVNGLEHTTTGNSYSNYLKINGESFGVMVGMYDIGVNFIPHFILDAGTYTMSLIAKGTSPGDYGQFGIIKFNSDGTKPSFTKEWATSDSRQSYTFTLDENSEIAIRVQAYGNASNAYNLDSTFSNIQLELGDTATDYVPYGHL